MTKIHWQVSKKTEKNYKEQNGKQPKLYLKPYNLFWNGMDGRRG